MNPHLITLHAVAGIPFYVSSDKIVYFCAYAVHSYSGTVNPDRPPSSIVYLVGQAPLMVRESCEDIINWIKYARRLHLDETLR